MKYISLLVTLFAAFLSTAQDMHFSQTSETPLFINPAAAGVFDGWERVTINHRNQWLGANTQFMTTAIAADMNLMKSRANDKAHLGLGVLFYSDIGGDSKFGNYTGAVTLNGILPISNGHSLSAGIQAGAGQRRADISSLSFLSQWDGTSLNPLQAHGEVNSLQSFMYLDASAGLLYVYDGGSTGFNRHNDFKLKIGFAGYHLNAPELKYATGSSDKLERKFVGHIDFTSDLGSRPLAITGSIVQFVQGGHYETILGAVLKYRFQNGTKITGNSQDAFIGFGVYHRVKDAVIPSFMIDWKGFRFMASYDVGISQMRNAYGGSLEFSIGYTNFDHALFKTRKRRF